MSIVAKKIIHNAKSFKELNKTLEKLTKIKKSKLAGDVFEYLTKLYLEISPEYKSKLKKVYLLNEVPTNLKKKLKLPNTDEGIDLIAETFDKEYWAIQCKYRSDNTETLKVKGDLATFNNLTFTVCKNISHGIVCATVNRPPKKTKLLNSIGFELFTTWLGLDKNNRELFRQIRSKAIGKIIRPKKLKPREHQKQARLKTIEHFKNNARGKLIMPCGTGKSLTAFWIAEKMKPKSILVAVPSLALLQQTLKVWTREFLLNNIEPDWLCVCSDDTVKEEQDDFVTSSSDLGIKVDTDPRVIRNFLKKNTNKLKIVFTTYQSGRATSIGSKGFAYDLGIMDEAHKTVGSKSKEMAHLLHQKNIKINKRLFMTATERLFRGDSDEYMSMDDPRDYGKLIYELSFKEAINSKPPIISDYKIITFVITNPAIEAIAQDNKYLEVKKELKDITARELATAIALRKAIKKLKIKNAISFHRSINRADNFRKQQDLITTIHPDYGKLKTFHVKGDMPTSDRALEMLAFEEEQGLMTNARCLTEGVDLPAIDCVCFTDPKKSKVDIVQAAGRALRLAKGKKFGYILIPIFIPDGMNFDEAAEEQGFDDVSVTVRALSTTDKRIVEYLREISEGKKPKGGSPVDGITSINQLYKIEPEEFNKAVQLKIWDKVAVSNWRSFNDAKRFVQSLNLNNYKSYLILHSQKKLPKDLPYKPERTYKNLGWNGWGDFLGTGYEHKKNYLQYNLAKKTIKQFNLKSQTQHTKFYKKNKKLFKDKNLSGFPANYYIRKNQWKGWGDYLGTGRIADQKKKFLSYEQAKKKIKKFNLKSNLDWKVFSKSKRRPLNIPASPDKTYKKSGWKNWPDFLSSGRILSKNVNFFEYKVAQKIIKKLKIKSEIEFREARKINKLPLEMPAKPYKFYKNKGWVNWGSFFGTGRIADQLRKYISFKDAKKIIQKRNLKSIKQYEQYLVKNKILNIPRKPNQKYSKLGWNGWSDYLGNDIINTQILSKNYYSYTEAQKKLSKMKILSKNDYISNIKQNKIETKFPLKPERVYKNKGWINFSHYIKRYDFVSYNSAKKLISKYKLKSANDYFTKHKKNIICQKIPLSPQYFYKDKWVSWSDFLGKDIKS